MISKDEFSEHAIALRSRQYRVAWALLKNEADCLDVMQEALAKAWGARRSLRDETLFATWLIRILINECKVILRKRSRIDLVPEPQLDGHADDSVPEVQYLVDALPDHLRLPFVLYHIEGYNIKEVAKMLSTTSSAIKNRVFRARNVLKNELRYEKEKEAQIQ